MNPMTWPLWGQLLSVGQPATLAVAGGKFWALSSYPFDGQAQQLATTAQNYASSHCG